MIVSVTFTRGPSGNCSSMEGNIARAACSVMLASQSSVCSAKCLACGLYQQQTSMVCQFLVVLQVTPVVRSSNIGSNSNITVLDGPALNLAQQSISISAAMRPLQDSSKQQQQQQERLSLSNVQLQLVGSHQAGNVQTAVAAALLLRQRGWAGISAEAIAAGLQHAWLPGRFQVGPSATLPSIKLCAAHHAMRASCRCTRA